MNKLRRKIFWTLLIILSIFLISILLIFNYQSYSREKTNIKQNLFRMNSVFNKDHPNKEIPKFDNDKNPLEGKEDEFPRRFMDALIYTVLLDDNNNILEIISHTESGLVDDKISNLALNIIDKNQKSNVYVGNLYFSDFSYKYEEGNYITIIDNQDINKRLLSLLWMSIFIFIFALLVIVILAKILSEWIIKPVELSFNKQKQFVADASHELKTPLSVIMACAETLESNPNEKKWLDNIKSESNRMSKLITSLLDLARIENENIKETHEEVNLSKLIEKSILSFESLAYEKSVKLDYEILENISFKCSSVEIRELMSILLDNAIKHSFKDEKVFISLKHYKNNIILEVMNQGDTIPEGESEKIFERFYRIDKSRNRNENRYGLGLAIAKSIVENHNGKISVASSNERTTFKIIFKI